MIFWKGVSSTNLTTRMALSLFLLVASLLVVYRFVHYWITGFFVPDEFGYVHDAIGGTIYGDRFSFGIMNILLFGTLRIDGVDKFSVLLPFYDLLWVAITVSASVLIMRLFSVRESVVSLTVLSFLFLVSFMLLSLGFLTEPVGLAFAMLGLLFMFKFAKGRDYTAANILYPLFSSLSFVMATYAREPYSIFLMLGGLLVFIVCRLRWSGLDGASTAIRVAAKATALALFVVPSVFFLYYPIDAISSQIEPIVLSLISMFFGSPTQGPPVGQPIEGQQPHMLNAAIIFAGGLALGWGPVLLGVGAIGFSLIIWRCFRGRSVFVWVSLISSLLALSSYFVVSYIFSPDPSYFSFSNYSTIIRFSDTALPAYFLLSPIAFAALVKKRPYVIATAALLIVFMLAAVPLYQTYAASNLTVGSSPFGLGYRTPAAEIRDYMMGFPKNTSYYILGYPYAWQFTPGAEMLPFVHVYGTERLVNSSIPYLSYQEFENQKWPVFYVYLSKSQHSYFAADLHINGTADPFTILSSRPVIQDTSFVLMEVHASWSS